MALSTIGRIGDFRLAILDNSKIHNPKSKIQNKFAEDLGVEWRVRAIRGATTASENTEEAIREAVAELLDELEARNRLDPNEIISAIFTTTRDLDAIFPAKIARERPHWDNVALLDVQQMYVKGDLERCIRFLIQINLPASQAEIHHPYLRQAQNLRPDWSLAEVSLKQPPAVQSHRR
ncbi:MAG TPA: chorismate mutase [Candidatus Obscuribacterales bacterium]